MYRILAINPGSTSTKIAVYEDETPILIQTIRHSAEELNVFSTIEEQYEFRKQFILQTLAENNISLSDFSAIVGRGGLLRPIASGTYEVNEKMLHDLRTAIYGEHASNLGGIIAHSIAKEISACHAFIVDPVVVDEMQDVARISGLPQIPRRSAFHALNQKAVARKYAAQKGVSYEQLNLVIAHLGGGISVSAHRAGKVIDTNQALGGFGAFSPERAGTLDVDAVVEMCFSGKYTKAQIKKMLVGEGGVMAHLGTNHVGEALAIAKNGNPTAKLITEAMSYNIAKEIGSMLVVLENRADAVILTGGIAYNQPITDEIKRLLNGLADVIVMSGEEEMEALTMGGLRVLKGEATSKVY